MNDKCKSDVKWQKAKKAIRQLNYEFMCTEKEMGDLKDLLNDVTKKYFKELCCETASDDCPKEYEESSENLCVDVFHQWQQDIRTIEVHILQLSNWLKNEATNGFLPRLNKLKRRICQQPNIKPPNLIRKKSVEKSNTCSLHNVAEAKPHGSLKATVSDGSQRQISKTLPSNRLQLEKKNSEKTIVSDMPICSITNTSSDSIQCYYEAEHAHEPMFLSLVRLNRTVELRKALTAKRREKYANDPIYEKPHVKRYKTLKQYTGEDVYNRLTRTTTIAYDHQKKPKTNCTKNMTAKSKSFSSEIKAEISTSISKTSGCTDLPVVLTDEECTTSKQMDTAKDSLTTCEKPTNCKENPYIEDVKNPVTKERELLHNTVSVQLQPMRSKENDSIKSVKHITKDKLMLHKTTSNVEEKTASHTLQPINSANLNTSSDSNSCTSHISDVSKNKKAKWSGFFKKNFNKKKVNKNEESNSCETSPEEDDGIETPESTAKTARNATKPKVCRNTEHVTRSTLVENSNKSWHLPKLNNSCKRPKSDYMNNVYPEAKGQHSNDITSSKDKALKLRRSKSQQDYKHNKNMLTGGTSQSKNIGSKRSYKSVLSRFKQRKPAKCSDPEKSNKLGSRKSSDNLLKREKIKSVTNIDKKKLHAFQKKINSAQREKEKNLVSTLVADKSKLDSIQTNETEQGVTRPQRLRTNLTCARMRRAEFNVEPSPQHVFTKCSINSNYNETLNRLEKNYFRRKQRVQDAVRNNHQNDDSEEEESISNESINSEDESISKRISTQTYVVQDSSTSLWRKDKIQTESVVSL